MALQGTTPQLNIPFDGTGLNVADFERAELTITQSGSSTTYYLSDMIVDTESNTLSYHFSETETLAWKKGEPLWWQIYVGIGSERYGTESSKLSPVKGKDKGSAME